MKTWQCLFLNECDNGIYRFEVAVLVKHWCMNAFIGTNKWHEPKASGKICEFASSNTIKIFRIQFIEDLDHHPSIKDRIFQ